MKLSRYSKILCIILLSGAVLSGCATTAGLVGFGKISEGDILAEVCVENSNLLKFWSSISGELQLRPSRLSVQTSATQTPAIKRIRLISPTAVAAQATDVFIADSGQKKIFKYDRATQTISVFANVPDMGNKVSLHVDRGLLVYLVNQVTATTVQYDIDGRRLKVFENAAELTQPVAVTVDDIQAEIFIADQLRAHVLVFNRGGGINRVINAPKGGKDKIQSITAMAFAKNQLYLVDRTGHQIFALSPTGKFRYVFGADELVAPGVIAVDDEGRVFVFDAANNAIKVYRGGLFEGELGDADTGTASRFQQVSGLWVDGDLLYVADAASASVKIFSIAPPCEQ
ncbi:NHL repeat-containing protein [Cardiobacterium sp. AH-315-I02]|nr:NHL repeat-containing protein [Cardiobacterium sp. AH-315-I02]